MTTTIRRPGTSFETARVADAMAPGLVSCSPSTSLRTVARMMAEHGIHAVYVFDYGDDGEPIEEWGLVTDLDVAAAACGEIDSMTAGRSAVTPLYTVKSGDRLERAAHLMAENDVSHLAVLDSATAQPIGVLSSLDVAAVVAEHDETAEKP